MIWKASAVVGCLQMVIAPIKSLVLVTYNVKRIRDEKFNLLVLTLVTCRNWVTLTEEWSMLTSESVNTTT